jgi:hypothetical protein
VKDFAMPTMHNRQRWGITERQLDRIQHERQTAAAHAAQQIIERARERQGICPPCTGNCVSSWSSIAFNCDSLRALVRSAIGWPWNIA